jgi:cell wall-associated NlpC family hydrolase
MYRFSEIGDVSLDFMFAQEQSRVTWIIYELFRLNYQIYQSSNLVTCHQIKWGLTGKIKRAKIMDKSMEWKTKKKLIFVFSLCMVLVMTGCARRPSVVLEAKPSTPRIETPTTGYTIQVGAFRKLDNAVQLTQALTSQNLDAFYFKHDSGLFKVRFGDFSTRKQAEEKAKSLKKAKIILDYFIVSPENHPVRQARLSGLDFVREQIVNRALSYLGLPYRWGGADPREGFDCSGLTMAVYRLVGLNLPHSSHSQFRSGIPIEKEDLRKGDLVFFRSPNEGRISHVGIYTGNGDFIHAPGKDQTIRLDSLSDRYFQEHYAGARTYISQISQDRPGENNKN